MDPEAALTVDPGVSGACQYASLPLPGSLNSDDFADDRAEGTRHEGTRPVDISQAASLPSPASGPVERTCL